MDRIKVAQWAQIHSLYLPLYVAIHEGFFQQNDLEVELLPVGNDDEVFEYVINGKADFGVSDPVFCAMKKYEDAQAKVLATIANRVGLWGITHNPVIQPIKNIYDLVGLRVGCFPRPSTNYALITSLKQTNKRLLSSLEIIEAPIGEQFDLLVNGNADIVLDIEPFVSLAESKGHKVVYSYADLHGPYTFTGFYTCQKYMDQKLDITKRAVKSIGQSLTAMNDNPELPLQTSMKLFPDYDIEVLRRSINRLQGEKVWKAIPDTERSAWRAAIKTRQNIGELFIKDIYAPLQTLN